MVTVEINSVKYNNKSLDVKTIIKREYVFIVELYNFKSGWQTSET